MTGPSPELITAAFCATRPVESALKSTCSAPVRASMAEPVAITMLPAESTLSVAVPPSDLMTLASAAKRTPALSPMLLLESVTSVPRPSAPPMPSALTLVIDNGG